VPNPLTAFLVKIRRRSVMCPEGNVIDRATFLGLIKSGVLRRHPALDVICQLATRDGK